jgi:glucose-1-phosphate thymidylyltransferase
MLELPLVKEVEFFDDTTSKPYGYALPIKVINDGTTSNEEKPEAPRSHFAVTPFYMYKQETLPLVKQYLEAGQNPDAPGNILPWLLQHREVYAFRFEGERYDVGTLENYEEVQRVFG